MGVTGSKRVVVRWLEECWTQCISYGAQKTTVVPHSQLSPQFQLPSNATAGGQ